MSFEVPSSFADSVREKISKGVEDSIEDDASSGLADFSEQMLSKINVFAKFKETNEEIEAARHRRLNHEAGLVISNHPSTVDAPLILQFIHRSDLKIVVKEALYYATQDSPLFHERLIPAGKSVSDALETVNQVVKHIKNGGLVLLFPSGGREIDVQENNFYSGFRAILSKMRPTDMIYNFNIDIGDNEHLKSKDNLHIQNGSAVLSGRPLPFSRFNQPTEVLLSERYTKAEEWQSIIDSSISNRDKNRLLGDHYRQIFEEQ